LALSGVTPGLQPGGQVLLTWSVPLAPPFAFALRAGARLSAQGRAEDTQGAAELELLSGLVAGCGGARLAHDAWAAWGCLALEPGRLSARGRDTRNPRDANRGWFAFGPGLVLQWTGATPLVVEAEAELQVPLVRDRFLLGRETVYRAPRIGVRAGIGVGVRLW
jgi:hypothetical protein